VSGTQPLYGLWRRCRDCLRPFVYRWIWRHFELPVSGTPLTLEMPKVHSILVESEQGIFAVHARDHIVGPCLASLGTWEASVIAHVRRILRPGDFCVDIGANFGWHTIAMQRAVGPRGKVVAIEPDSENRRVLEWNLRLAGAGNVVVLPLAIWESGGQVTLELAPDNFGDHRVRAARRMDAMGESSRRCATVPAMRLDDAMEAAAADRASDPLRLLKIDAQGSEVAIFRGAPDTLARTDCLLAEFWPYGLAAAGHTASEYLEFVHRHFRRFLILEHRGVAVPGATCGAVEDLSAAIDVSLDPHNHYEFLFDRETP